MADRASSDYPGESAYARVATRQCEAVCLGGQRQPIRQSRDGHRLCVLVVTPESVIEVRLS